MFKHLAGISADPNNDYVGEPLTTSLTSINLCKRMSVVRQEQESAKIKLSQRECPSGKGTPIDESLSRPLRQLWKGTHSEVTLLVSRKPKNMVLQEPVTYLRIDSVLNDGMNATNCKQKAILRFGKTIPIDKTLNRPLRQLWKGTHSQDPHLDSRKPKNKVSVDPVTYCSKLDEP